MEPFDPILINQPLSPSAQSRLEHILRIDRYRFYANRLPRLRKQLLHFLDEISAYHDLTGFWPDLQFIYSSQRTCQYRKIRGEEVILIDEGMVELVLGFHTCRLKPAHPVACLSLGNLVVAELLATSNQWGMAYFLTQRLQQLLQEKIDQNGDFWPSFRWSLYPHNPLYGPFVAFMTGHELAHALGHRPDIRFEEIRAALKSLTFKNVFRLTDPDIGIKDEAPKDAPERSQQFKEELLCDLFGYRLAVWFAIWDGQIEDDRDYLSLSLNLMHTIAWAGMIEMARRIVQEALWDPTFGKRRRIRIPRLSARLMVLSSIITQAAELIFPVDEAYMGSMVTGRFSTEQKAFFNQEMKKLNNTVTFLLSKAHFPKAFGQKLWDNEAFAEALFSVPDLTSGSLPEQGPDPYQFMLAYGLSNSYYNLVEWRHQEQVRQLVEAKIQTLGRDQLYTFFRRPLYMVM